MTGLILPNLSSDQMGQVTITMTMTNWVDQVMSDRKFIPVEEVRSRKLDNVLVDTGATLLCLPAAVIQQLGLVQGGEASVKTTAGVKMGRIFRGVDLCISDRHGTFDCLELTEASYALLGVIPMETLGLEPDLKNRRLRILPMNAEQTYLSVL